MLGQGDTGKVVEDPWKYAAYIVGLPIWLAAVTFMVRTVRIWPGIMEQWNTRQRDKENAKSGLMDRYETRLSSLELKEEDCQRKLTDALRRLAQVEGFMMGQGKARQEAANIVAVERLSDKESKKP